MFRILAAVLAVAPTLYSNGRPPERFQQNATVTLEVQDQAGIDRICHPLFGRPPAGRKTDACQTGRRVIAPNPCNFPKEAYARLLCHELGHANGWSRRHDGWDQGQTRTAEGLQPDNRPARSPG